MNIIFLLSIIAILVFFNIVLKTRRNRNSSVALSIFANITAVIPFIMGLLLIIAQPTIRFAVLLLFLGINLVHTIFAPVFSRK